MRLRMRLLPCRAALRVMASSGFDARVGPVDRAIEACGGGAGRHLGTGPPNSVAQARLRSTQPGATVSTLPAQPSAAPPNRLVVPGTAVEGGPGDADIAPNSAK